MLIKSLKAIALTRAEPYVCFPTSVSLFLPCKLVHLYHFSRLHTNVWTPRGESGGGGGGGGMNWEIGIDIYTLICIK